MAKYVGSSVSRAVTVALGCTQLGEDGDDVDSDLDCRWLCGGRDLMKEVSSEGWWCCRGLGYSSIRSQEEIGGRSCRR